MSEPSAPGGGPGTSRLTWEQAVAALLNDPQQQSLARDGYFTGTALEAAARYWASDEWRAVRTLLPRVPGRALDVGAGRGVASYALCRDGWAVCALEPDSSALVGAQAIRSIVAATGYSIDVFEEYAENLPFGDAQFDLVVARQALHHACDLNALLRQLHRVLRPGGRLIALRDHVISKTGDLPRFHALHPLHHLYGGENAYTLEQYISAISRAGFSLRRVIRPLESPINLAPLSREILATEIAARLPDVFPVRGFARRLLRVAPVMSIALKAISWIDNRPGRLYSFVADKGGSP